MRPVTEPSPTPRSDSAGVSPASLFSDKQTNKKKRQVNPTRRSVSQQRQRIEGKGRDLSGKVSPDTSTGLVEPEQTLFKCVLIQVVKTLLSAFRDPPHFKNVSC